MTHLRNIRDAFDGDKEIMDYFDPMATVTCVEEVSKVVYEKIKEYERIYECTFIVNKYGYIFYTKEMLISFCVKKSLRNRENLVDFWELIKGQLGTYFKCHLYTKNTRGINWLIKCGMRIEMQDKLTTLLTL